MMRRTRKDAARRSFENRRNDRRKHGLGRVEEYGDESHWTGAGDSKIEADEPQYEAITWRGRYYHSKLGFRGVEECQPGSPAATLVALCRELSNQPDSVLNLDLMYRRTCLRDNQSAPALPLDKKQHLDKRSVDCP